MEYIDISQKITTQGQVTAVNNVLNVNLSATLSGGKVRVNAWGTEE